MTATQLNFVNRNQELLQLHAALDAAESGTPAAVIVHGETGIGKTRLAKEFAEQARERGSTVLWGSRYEAGPPLAAWEQAIAGHLDALHSDRVMDLVGSDAEVFAQLIPALEKSSTPVRSPLVTRHDGADPGLSDAVARFLDSLGTHAVLVLDDLHRADPTALDLLCQVARSTVAPLMVVMYRGRELNIGFPLARALGELNRLRPTTYMRLDGLDPTAATTMLEDVGAGPVDVTLAQAIYDESGGNPFFLHELGRHLLGQKTVPTAAEDWTSPESVRQAVAVSLSAVSSETRRMLELASIFRAPFGFPQLQALTDLDEETLLRCLDEALTVDLLRAADVEHYDFRHAIVRNTLYTEYSPSRRASLHRRLAETLLQKEDGPDREAELARQYHASASLPGAEAGVSHALSAAEHARATHAPAEAADLLRIALELTPGDDLTARASITGEIALAQAEAAMIEQARLSLEAALDLMEESHATPEESVALVHRVVSRLLIAIPHPDALEPLIARALQALGDEHGLAWARLRLIQRPRVPVTGPIYAAGWGPLDPEAVEIARTQGNDEDYARTINWYGAISDAELDELLQRIENWRDPTVKLQGLIGAIHRLVLRHGSTPTVQRLLAEQERLGSELHSIPALAFAALQRGAMLGEQGQFGAAEASFAEAHELAELLGADSQIGVGTIFHRELVAQHVAPDWPRLARSTWQLASSSGSPLWSMVTAAFAAHAFAKAKEAGQAREILALITPELLTREPTSHRQNASISLASEAVWELRDKPLAEDLIECALDVLESGTGDWDMTSNELTVARLAAVLGRYEEANAYFERARLALEQRDQRPLRAIVDHDEAISRRWARQPGAPKLLAAAQAQFTELGMAVWEARAASMQTTEQLPDDLTPREAEVLRLLAAGATNQEIADALVLSVNTVERHLTNSYRKLDVRNRSDATAYVLRTGL